MKKEKHGAPQQLAAPTRGRGVVVPPGDQRLKKEKKQRAQARTEQESDGVAPRGDRRPLEREAPAAALHVVVTRAYKKKTRRREKRNRCAPRSSDTRQSSHPSLGLRVFFLSFFLLRANQLVEVVPSVDGPTR